MSRSDKPFKRQLHNKKSQTSKGNVRFSFHLGPLFEKMWTIFRTNLLCLSSKPLYLDVYTGQNRLYSKSPIDYAGLFLMICWHSFSLHEPNLVMDYDITTGFVPINHLPLPLTFPAKPAPISEATGKLTKDNICSLSISQKIFERVFRRFLWLGKPARDVSRQNSRQLLE